MRIFLNLLRRVLRSKGNHASLNSMYKKILKLLTLYLLFTQLHCSGKKSPEMVRVPDKPGNDTHNKEDVTDVAPTFVENQLQKNQFIVWKRTSPNGTFDCLRWKIGDFPAQGVTLDSQSSKNCKDYDDKLIEHITFNSGSGKVEADYISSPESCPVTPLDPLKTIFGHLYGSRQKVTFQQGIKKWDKNDLPAFWLKKEPSRVFLNLPGTPFHGFVLSWTEEDEDGKWSYELIETNPPILPIPANPLHR